jgi:hypothetical protein
MQRTALRAAADAERWTVPVVRKSQRYEDQLASAHKSLRLKGRTVADAAR